MTKPKRIEFITFDGCESCDVALQDILPMAKKKGIPVHVLPLRKGDVFVPKTCVVKEENGVESEECIEGWDEDFADDVRKLVEK